MDPITVRELADAVGGRLIGPAGCENQIVRGICRDSRNIQPEEVFLPLIGDRNDGHRFIPSAFEHGASGTLTMHEPENPVPSHFYVAVKDTRTAYGDLAAWYRGRFRFPVIGITGSAGKTTTKDMVAAVLNEHFRVMKTPENFNNDIGMPETILSIEKGCSMAVLEMGMNHFGEISYLTKISRPDVAIIINVGHAHIENLGSREGILKAKCEIFDGVPRETGLAVLNGDDDMLRSVKEYPVPVVWCGEREDCEARCLEIHPEGDGMAMDADVLGERIRFEIPQAGRHMMYSVLMAAVIGKKYGMRTEEIVRGVRHFVPSGKRMLTHFRRHNITLIDDTYNANPTAVQAVLRILADRPEKKKIAVLGDMLELGEQGPALHRLCGEAAKANGIDLLIAIGPVSRYTAEAARGGKTRVLYFEDKDSAAAALRDEVISDCAVIFKASHGMQFSTLVDYMLSITEEKR